MALPTTILRHASTVDPRFLSAERWARETAWNLSPIGTIPVLHDEEDWRRWADAVVALPALSALGAPRSTGFGTWQAWASEFNISAQLVQFAQ